MRKRYTKNEIKEKWKELLNDPDLLYHNGSGIFNYKGVLEDAPAMLYIDYIAKLILDDNIILDSIGENLNDLRYSRSFNIGHDGKSDSSSRLMKYGRIRFNEKPFAMALYNSGHNFLFGKIFDYELPLKERLTSRYGEIDILSKIDNEIYVIELKIGYTDSGKISETLLRAIMETFTFTKLLNIRKDNFIKDMKLPETITFRPVILTMTNALSADHMKMLENGELKNINNLIDEMNKYFSKLNILPFKFFAIDGHNPELIQDNKRIIFKDPSFVHSKVIEFFLPPAVAIRPEGKYFQQSIIISEVFL
ncbi:hypothetical protein METP3_01012 [Methanosarcinales archaeon]|nr:hypothetical protein METP3_01012 [Methanosarcinales archaeon]